MLGITKTISFTSKFTRVNNKQILSYLPIVRNASFMNRHIGIRTSQEDSMLEHTPSLSVSGLVKNSINLENYEAPYYKHNIKAKSETEVSEHLQNILSKNKPHLSMIGLGYHNVITPFPIQRHILENPKWYTAYTPYQAEISQGRLEAQYNFQTVIQELTGLPISNASLLDEASTGAEVLNMCYHYQNKNKKKTFLVDTNVLPQVKEVIQTKAEILGVNLVFADLCSWSENWNLLVNHSFDYEDVFGILFGYPGTTGKICVPENLIKSFSDKKDVTICASSDILSLCCLESPEKLGVDICFGTTQRLGVPLFFGGPHPAYLAAKPEYIRLMPGRIIGKSQDSRGKECFRLGLQTREQHIRKEKATSNICTSQSLLANVVGFYVYLLGRENLINLAQQTHFKTRVLAHFLKKHGLHNQNKDYFDTLHLKGTRCIPFLGMLKENDIMTRVIKMDEFSITLDETITLEDIVRLVNFAASMDGVTVELDDIRERFNTYERKLEHSKTENIFKFGPWRRSDDNFLQCDKFREEKTETEFLRYVTQLNKKDYTLCDGMIPLGSCTMKLNSVYQLMPLSWPSVQNYHPYTDKEYVMGYHHLFDSLGYYLQELTGFSNVSFQSNSGAMGEYSGLLCIKKYHQKNKQEYRKICLIPKSAHGTNFASAHLAGLKVVSYDDDLSMEEFTDLVQSFRDELACLMITYPGTNGIFQSNIREICDVIHYQGGLVYLDGANMNALVGLVKPADVGADVCHLNLHKTFCIPHGGGGPGMGPILCNEKLSPYLPTNIFQSENYQNNSNSIGMITGSQWSSASLLTIPYQYILGMGISGLKRASETAILNANYLKDQLKGHYKIVDTNEQGRVAHEFIIDASPLRKYKITELDIAKRMMDYSFHPPTMSWPRPGVLMFEPTESENKEELDRLVRALKKINLEIQDIIMSENYENNLLKNAPHSLDLILDWPYEYEMKDAYFPLPELQENKFWPTTNRIDDIQGDKNLLKNRK